METTKTTLPHSPTANAVQRQRMGIKRTGITAILHQKVAAFNLNGKDPLKQEDTCPNIPFARHGNMKCFKQCYWHTVLDNQGKLARPHTFPFENQLHPSDNTGFNTS